MLWKLDSFIHSIPFARASLFWSATVWEQRHATSEGPQGHDKKMCTWRHCTHFSVQCAIWVSINQHLLKVRVNGVQEGEWRVFYVKYGGLPEFKTHPLSSCPKPTLRPKLQTLRKIPHCFFSLHKRGVWVELYYPQNLYIMYPQNFEDIERLSIYTHCFWRYLVCSLEWVITANGAVPLRLMYRLGCTCRLPDWSRRWNYGRFRYKTAKLSTVFEVVAAAAPPTSRF